MCTGNCYRPRFRQEEEGKKIPVVGITYQKQEWMTDT